MALNADKERIKASLSQPSHPITNACEPQIYLRSVVKNLRRAGLKKRGLRAAKTIRQQQCLSSQRESVAETWTDGLYLNMCAHLPAAREFLIIHSVCKTLCMWHLALMLCEREKENTLWCDWVHCRFTMCLLVEPIFIVVYWQIGLEFVSKTFGV